MKKTIFKTVFSTVLTWVVVSSAVFAFTNTVPHQNTNDVVTASEWNTIKTTIDSLKNSINFTNYYTKQEATNKFIDSTDLTACGSDEVAKMTNSGFICVTSASQSNTNSYSKEEIDNLLANLPQQDELAIIQYSWGWDPEWCDYAYKNLSEFKSKWDEMNESEAISCEKDIENMIKNGWYGTVTVDCPVPRNSWDIAYCKVTQWSSSTGWSSSWSSWGSGWGGSWGSSGIYYDQR